MITYYSQKVFWWKLFKNKNVLLIYTLFYDFSYLRHFISFDHCKCI